MKHSIIILTITLALFSQPSLATQCRVYPSGPTKDVPFNLTNSFNASNNAAGKIVILSLPSIGVQATCVKDPSYIYNDYATYRTYVTSLTPHSTEGNLKYFKLNDYLAGALETTDSYYGKIYPPIEYARMGSFDPRFAFPISETNIRLHLKVLRPFISKTDINIKIFDVYVVSNTADTLQVPVYSISLNGTIDVPQTCTLNSNKVVSFDFKSVSSSLFRKAGAGARVTGVPAQSRSITVACSNVDTSASLSLRLQAHNSAGNTIISDNPDVGFVLANGDDNTQLLKPNDINSFIPFTLDSSGQATAQLSAWLTSVTGQAPKGGLASAQAFLRVDFP